MQTGIMQVLSLMRLKGLYLKPLILIKFMHMVLLPGCTHALYCINHILYCSSPSTMLPLLPRHLDTCEMSSNFIIVIPFLWSYGVIISNATFCMNLKGNWLYSIVPWCLNKINGFQYTFCLCFY